LSAEGYGEEGAEGVDRSNTGGSGGGEGIGGGHVGGYEEEEGCDEH